MKLNTKTRYGLRLLFNLALDYEKGFIQLHEIARRENISEKYLEQIVSFLKSAGFVQSQRGAQGGYRLARTPAQIDLASVVGQLEGSLSIMDCLEGEDCARQGTCPTQQVWKRLNAAILGTLSAITLGQMVDDFHRDTGNVSYDI